ncbi:MAG TPA: DUF4169 family protein [Hyphomicrobiales bacterium]|nr:DUF4169 family protein [Kaistiaceae bacterium]HQF30979.1 DUF4169 family protein [Hyphomicrobiales bacterium]
MSGEIVNLRQFRKGKARADKAASAAENRAKHGRSKAEKTLEAARDTLAGRRHEGHRRDRPDDSSDA